MEQNAELVATPQTAQKDARRLQFFTAWRQESVQINAQRNAQNEVTKTRIDLEVKDLKERKDVIGKKMGEVLEDMSKGSRDRVKYVKVLDPDGDNEGSATTLDEAREIGDWLFMFEAARETHLFQGVGEDRVLIFEKTTFRR